MNNINRLLKRRQPATSELARDPKLSRWSSPAVPSSGWSSSNFMLGAGMVIIQRKTHKIVVIEHGSAYDYWFFPRGRKDLGETLEAAALREAYEESGYRVKFLPIHNPSRAPAPPQKAFMYDEPNTEPVYITATAWSEKRPHLREGPDANLGYEYINFYYVGQIPEDAVPEIGTKMEGEEQEYVSHLLSYEEAMKKVWSHEKDVLRYAWAVYLHTLEAEGEEAALGKEQKEEEGRNEKAEGSFRKEYGTSFGEYEGSIASIE